MTQYPENFLEAYKRLELSEKGFTRNPKDRGNWTSGRIGVGTLKGTKYGISAMTYPHLDIVNLTPADAMEIYYVDWWLRLGADRLPFAVAYQVWQFSVNAGMGNGKRCLQRAARVGDDGDIGPLTLAALEAMSATDILARFFAATIRYYTALSPANWGEFGRGWMNRVAEQLDLMAQDT